MTTIYHQSKEAAAEARLARQDQPAVTYAQAKFDPATWKQEYEWITPFKECKDFWDECRDVEPNINGLFLSEINRFDIQFPKSTHSSQGYDKG